MCLWSTGWDGGTDAHKKEKRGSRIKERMKLSKDVASAGAWHQPDPMGALQCDWHSRAHPTHRGITQSLSWTQVRRKGGSYLPSMWGRQLLWTQGKHSKPGAISSPNLGQLGEECTFKGWGATQDTSSGQSVYHTYTYTHPGRCW